MAILLNTVWRIPSSILSHFLALSCNTFFLFLCTYPLVVDVLISTTIFCWRKEQLVAELVANSKKRAGDCRRFRRGAAAADPLICTTDLQISLSAKLFDFVVLMWS